MRERLFDSMVSVRPGTGGDVPHLGLGLYIVRLIAEFHGGTARADDRARRQRRRRDDRRSRLQLKRERRSARIDVPMTDAVPAIPLDLPAYLRRIDYAGELSPSRATLDALASRACDGDPVRESRYPARRADSPRSRESAGEARRRTVGAATASSRTRCSPASSRNSDSRSHGSPPACATGRTACCRART